MSRIVEADGKKFDLDNPSDFAVVQEKYSELLSSVPVKDGKKKKEKKGKK